MSIAPSPTAADLKRVLTDVRAICAALGLDRGARVQLQGLLILCPWHAEKHASCSVRLGADGTVFVKCFACGAVGDVLTLIAQARGLDIRTQFALVLVEAQRIAEHVAAGPGSHAQIHTSDSKNNSDARASVAEALLAACPLAAAPEACAYLQGRHLLEDALTEDWGALPAAIDKIILVTNRVLLSVGLETWTQSGIPSSQGRLPWEDHQLLIPWRDPSGNITTLQRRLIRPAGEDEQPYVFPRGGAPAWPYGVELVASTNESVDIVFVEGAMDALALRALYHQHGIERLVLAVPGVANIRREWAELARGRTAYVAFDRDEAGDVAAILFAAKLHRVGALRVVRCRPSHGKDWAEQLANQGAS